MVQTTAVTAVHDSSFAGSIQRIPEEVRMHNLEGGL